MRSSSAAESRGWFVIVLLLVLGTIWGGSFTLIRLATTHGAHPFGLSMWEGLGGGSVVLMFLLWRGGRLRLNRRLLTFYLVCGMGGITIPSLAFYFASPHLPAGVLAMAVTLTPLLTYTFALSLAMEGFELGRAFGIVCGFAGVLLIVLPEASLPTPGLAGWVLVGFIAPLCYAGVSITVTRWRPPGVDSVELACGMLFASAVVMTPVAFLSGHAITMAPPWRTVEWANLGLIAVAGLARVLYFEILRRAGPVFFSQVSYIVTVTGVGWGMIVFGERHSLWIWAALAVMLLGLAMVSPRATDAGTGS